MLVKGGQISVTTSCQLLPPYSAVSCFLSMWLQKHHPGFRDYPDVGIVKRLLHYIRLHVPSSDATIQAEELLYKSPKRILAGSSGKQLQKPQCRMSQGQKRHYYLWDQLLCIKEIWTPKKTWAQQLKNQLYQKLDQCFWHYSSLFPNQLIPSHLIDVAANVPTVK